MESRASGEQGGGEGRAKLGAQVNVMETGAGRERDPFRLSVLQVEAWGPSDRLDWEEDGEYSVPWDDPSVPT